MHQKKVLVIHQSPTQAASLLTLLQTQNVVIYTVDSETAAKQYTSKMALDGVFSESMPTKGTGHLSTIPYFPLSKEGIEQFCTQAALSTSLQPIAESAQMRLLFEKAKKIAESEANVFITGESGTGKEVLAQYIHTHSSRSGAPFAAVNCAAIPEALLESEFFGHVSGAFTGAIAERKGRFESAHSGTLFLDEVTEIPMHLQAKLLRAIQEQTFEKVGSSTPLTVSVRFIAASNRNIQDAIDEGVFRKDLYYRLGVVPLCIPPLRERTDDILPLARFFLSKACIKNNLPEKKLSDEACPLLLQYSWPGNVREIANMMEHAAVISEKNLLLTSDIPLTYETPDLQKKYPFQGLSLKEVEKIHIQETLAACNYNKTRAAEKLHISIRTLRNKIRTFQKN